MMKKMRMIWNYIASCKIWMIMILCSNLFFIFLAWIAYPKMFFCLIGLMAFVSLVSLSIPTVILLNRRRKEDAAFDRFLNQPDEANEYMLCEATPRSLHSFIHKLGQHLRTQKGDFAECRADLEDYESYIENWAHEMKKPLSLMTLLLDNRKEEMSPLVRRRMIYVRDQARQNVEQVLYYARLGAIHKDYCWEPISLLEVCREAVEDNKSLIEEAGFLIEFTGEECKVISDKKGMMFILGQLICNSVKYASDHKDASLVFAVDTDPATKKIVLSVRDNGKGIPKSDLPFIFDKGFTGDRGSYLSRSTGMGLYLVKKMTRDLTIDINVESTVDHGTTFSLIFPMVE